MVGYLDTLKDRYEIQENSIIIFPDTIYKFTTTNGYIEYIKFVLDNILNDCKNKELKESITKIFDMLSKLKDENVRFNGNTKEEFNEYVNKVSKLYDDDNFEEYPLNIIKLEGKENILDSLDLYTNRKNMYCFVYDNQDDMNKYFKEELLKVLNNIKFTIEKDYNISNYLTISKYHEHIHDAINTLVSTLVYGFNCYSFRNEDGIFEDLNYLNQNMEFVKNSIKRIQYVK